MMMMRRLALPVRLPCLNMSRGLVRQVKHPLPPSHILRLLVSPVALPRSKARVFIKRTARVRTNSPTVLPRTVFFASDAFLLLQDPSTVAAFSLVGRFLALYQSARARYGIEFLEAGFPLVRANPIKARSFARRQLRLEAARGSMGAGVSELAGVEACKVSRAGLGELPELCAAEVLLYLDAPDICRLALLNRTFRGAAAADFVWEAKLPGNYGYLLGFVHGAEEEEEGGGMRSAMGKKEVYARLAKPVLFDDGKREFWLEKSKGRFCMALSSKALVITGIDDRRYWAHMPTTESRFHSVAYLQQIWWFEVVGEIVFCFPAGTYSLYFRLHLGKASKRSGRRVCSSEHIHGWDKKPVRFQLSTSDGQLALSQCYLDEPGSWILYHVGDFVASKPEQPVKLKFSLAQIDCTHTKGGLCIDSVLIYPKGFQQEKVVRAQK